MKSIKKFFINRLAKAKIINQYKAYNLLFLKLKKYYNLQYKS